MADATCPTSIKQGFSKLMELFNGGKEDLTQIEKIFRLCPGQMTKQYLEKNMLAWARNAFTLLAMVDYPYPAKFMADLPGNPVNVACSYMIGNDKLAGLSNITSKYSVAITAVFFS